MKKAKLLGLASLLLSLGVVGCEKEEPEGPKYENDRSWHWLNDAEGNIDAATKEKHTYELDTEQTVEATCAIEGKKVEKCTVCGYEKITTQNKKNHSFEVDTARSTESTCSQAGTKIEVCKNCGFEKPTTLELKEHTYVEDTTKRKEPNCKEEGEMTEVCSFCTNPKVTVLPKTPHTFEDVTTISEYVANTTSAVTKGVCKDCGAVDICVDAMKWTAIDGKNKDGGPENTLKLNSNGNSTTYKFTLDKAFSGKIYIMGQVDYWYDGSNNNQNRSFTSRKSGDGFNLEVKVNDNLVDITNTKTYEEMGMEAGNTIGSTTYSTLALCELGDATLQAGENVINYKRIESYNLNITEIHFIGNFAD